MAFQDRSLGSPKCGVPEWTIKALARAWDIRDNQQDHGNGGHGIRTPIQQKTAGWSYVYWECVDWAKRVCTR
jgi:hypothetical protein